MDSVESDDQNSANGISRREFLKGVGIGTGLVAISSILGSSRGPLRQVSTEEPEIPIEQLYPTELILHENNYVRLSENEKRINLEQYGRKWVPDSHFPFIRTSNGTKLAMITGAGASYPYKLSSDWNMEPANEGIPSLIRDPRVPYKNGYAAITSLINPVDDNLNLLVGFSHNEQWVSSSNGGGFTASIGLTISNDGGKTFTDYGPIIKGRAPQPPGERVSGAGQPCAIKIKEGDQDYVYVFYVEWAPNLGTADQIYLSRLNFGPNAQLTTPEHWTTSGFSTDPNNLQPVITPPHTVPNSNYAAIPSISWNTKINKFLASYETNVGVCITSSDDCINWDNHELIAEYPVPLSQVWATTSKQSYSYPSLVSINEDADWITNDKVDLVIARNVGPNSPHSISVIRGEIIS